MKHRPALALGSSIVLFLAAGTAVAQQVTPRCTDNSRACMITAATAYFDALVTHDASKVPFAPDVRRTEQGRVTGVGEQHIREHTKTQPDMKGGRHNTRFWVDEETRNVIGAMVIRIVPDQDKADPARKSIPVTEPRTGRIFERFKVENGLIKEIEAIFHLERGTMDGTSGWPDFGPVRPVGSGMPQVKPPCTDNSRTCLIGAAASYLDNIVRKDGSKTLFAPNVRRTVQSRELVGEAALRRNLDNEPPINGHRNTRYFVDRPQNTVIAFTLLPVPPRDGPNPTKGSTTHLVERYTMVDGLITEIEGIFYQQEGTMEGESGWPDAK